MKKELSSLPYYGVHAVLKIFSCRKEDIQRVYCLKSKIPAIKPLLSWCAEHKKPYHLVEDKDLEKLTDSTHHEGVCCMASPMKSYTEDQFFRAVNKKTRVLAIYLNEVDNPHNLGAILRTLAHFGVEYLLLDHPIRLTPSCCRIAQGGAEHVKVVYVTQGTSCFSQIKKAGFTLYGTSSHEGESLDKSKLSPKSMIVMGSESHGISKELKKQIQTWITIPGSNAVESLNVSAATALFCYGYHTQHP